MYRKRAILFVVSVALLAALFYSIDFGRFFEAASRLTLEWLAVLVLVQAAVMFLTVLKWHVLIRRYGVSFGNVFKTSMIAWMVNNVTPASYVGGEAARAYIIGRLDKVKTEKAVATVLADLFLNIVPVLFLDAFAIVLVLRLSMDLRIAWFLAIVGIFIIALILSSFSIILRREPSMRLFNGLIEFVGRIRFLRERVRRVETGVDELFMGFHKGLKDAMVDTKTLESALAMSFAVWALTLLRVYLVFIALGIPIDPEVLIIIYSVLILVGILPLLPGALGLWEWAGAGLFAFFGVPLESAVAVVVVDRLLFYWLPILAGLVTAMHVGLSVSKLVDKDG
jgi:glycosyltransferase 2 family protein